MLVKRFGIFLSLLALSISVALAAGGADEKDPEAALREIRAWVSDQLKQAQEKNTQPNITELRNQQTEKARAAVQGVDPAAAEPGKCYAWAQLFQMAQMPKEQIVAANRFLTANPDSEARYNAQILLLNGYQTLDDAKGLYAVLKEVKPPKPLMAASFASMTANIYAETIAKHMGVPTALELIKRVESMVALDDLKTPMDRQRGESAIVSLAISRAELLQMENKREAALESLETAKKRLSADSRLLSRLNAQIRHIQLPGSPAPELKKERGYGSFESLASLRGKVVVLEFTAHW